ncbi:MAG: biotin--[acetyl-CoA-carboxylase] ligase, partial [Alphaproteobacteria bacterium]
MAADPVLAALAGGEWRSGQALAADLGVTRAAVWKSIERLRREGYRIEAEAGRGYRLLGAPDRLLPGEIAKHFRPRRFAGGVVHRDEVDSTNRLAIELARGGAAEGTAVVAEKQTAGRGRLGRTWESPPGLNLYLSVILRPALSPVEVPRLTLAAAVAVADAIAATTGLRPEIKWPNDVLVDGRKACGILTELEAEA